MPREVFVTFPLSKRPLKGFNIALISKTSDASVTHMRTTDPSMIEFGEFQARMINVLPPGTILDNPGGGKTTIRRYSGGKVSYVRGNSTIRVAIRDLFSAYSKFRGRRVSSSDLRQYAPHVFDSNARPAGHSCNCTFLFTVLSRLGIAGPIQGEGRAYKPYFTTLQ